MWLLHGTTRFRGEAIIATGPDIGYIEPGGEGVIAENFSECVEGWGSALGRAEEYARNKNRGFPDEGGGVVVAIDVPDKLVRMAAREHLALYAGIFPVDPNATLMGLLASCGGVIQFDPGPALDQLLGRWGKLPKEIRGVP